MRQAFLSLKRQMFRFTRGRTGNVAITFALATLPVIGSVGAAVDYSRANKVSAQLQAALDSTALRLSKEAAADSPAQLQASATTTFLALFNAPEARDRKVTANFSTDRGTALVVNGSAAVPTVFTGIIGINVITVHGSSTAEWGSTKLRVALALDNTGSMQQSGKMAALKTATKNFLSQLKDGASNNGDIYVSVIPFSTSVNVGSANYTQSWLDWSEYGSCSGFGWGTSSAYTQALCKSANGTWSAYPSSQRKSWTGCVTDRGNKNGPTGQAYDTTAAPPANNKQSKYPAVDYDACPQQAMGLGFDWATMNSLVDNMWPNGNTNQNIGLQVAWMSLVGGGPFSVPAQTPGYNYTNIIVLFTDGLNTEDRWYSDQSSIDDRQAMTCNNIKAAGVVLYTVQISTDGTPASTLLSDCASDKTKFFYLTSSSQLVTAFAEIGTNLTNLRLAR